MEGTLLSLLCKEVRSVITITEHTMLNSPHQMVNKASSPQLQHHCICAVLHSSPFPSPLFSLLPSVPYWKLRLIPQNPWKLELTQYDPWKLELTPKQPPES